MRHGGKKIAFHSVEFLKVLCMGALAFIQAAIVQSEAEDDAQRAQQAMVAHMIVSRTRGDGEYATDVEQPPPAVDNLPRLTNGT